MEKEHGRRDFLRKAAKAAGAVGFTGAALGGIYAYEKFRTPGERDYSIENIYVWTDYILTTGGVGEKTGNGYFNVDFRGMGDSFDATLGVKLQKDGSYELSVRVLGKFVPTSVYIRDGMPYRTETGNAQETGLKWFRGSAEDREDLIPAVHKLLREARDYATSPQFEKDLDDLLDEFTRRDNRDFEAMFREHKGGIKTIYNRYEGNKGW